MSDQNLGIYAYSAEELGVELEEEFEELGEEVEEEFEEVVEEFEEVKEELEEQFNRLEASMNIFSLIANDNFDIFVNGFINLPQINFDIQL